jgi:hypothetical protein
MTQIWVAGCWVQFPYGAAYVLVSYGLSCAALLRFFLLVLLIFKIKVYIKRIKLCDLNLEFCRLHWW